MINSTPNIQNSPVIPSPTDDASKIVGYNIDNFIDGKDTFNKQNQNGSSLPKSNLSNNSLYGFLALGGILAAGFMAAKALFKK